MLVSAVNIILAISYGTGTTLGFVLGTSSFVTINYQHASSVLNPSFSSEVPSSTYISNAMVTSSTATALPITPSHSLRKISVKPGLQSSYAVSSDVGFTTNYQITPTQTLPTNNVRSTTLTNVKHTTSLVRSNTQSTVTSLQRTGQSSAPAMTATLQASPTSTAYALTFVTSAATASHLLSPPPSVHVNAHASTASELHSIPATSINIVPATSINTVPATSTNIVPATSTNIVPANSIHIVPATSINIVPATSINPVISQMVTASSSFPSIVRTRSVPSVLSSRTNTVVPSISTTLTSFLIPVVPTKVFPPLNPTPSAFLSTVSSPNIPTCAHTGMCCTNGLKQLPTSIMFKESLQPGSVLAQMNGMWNVSVAITVAQPPGFQAIVRDYFTIVNQNDTYKLMLSQEFDLEEVYIKANRKKDVHQFQLQLNCFENGLLFPSRVIDVTVEDVDDSMPVFEHGGSGPSCVVPVYQAGANEDYTGELQISPGKIKAVDGDLTQRHNISYKVMHSEPDDYHEYFYVDSADGAVNKTRSMNASNPRKFVIFVQAIEDSPNKKNRVAILTIDVYAPLADNEDPITVDPAVKYALQIISALVIIAFIAGFLVVLHHRYRQRKVKVDPGKCSPGEEQDMRLPKLAVYKSSASSLNSLIQDIPVITSPSQVAVRPKEKLFQKRKKIIVKKPLDTSARPGWNAPPSKAKRVSYNPYVAVQKVQKP